MVHLIQHYVNLQTTHKIPDEIGRWDRTMEERLETLVAGYRYLADLFQKESKPLVKKATIQHKISSLILKQSNRKTHLDDTKHI